VVPEIAQILGNGVLIRGEGSKQLSSQQRCDHFQYLIPVFSSSEV